MSGFSWTNDTILESIRVRAMMPSAQQTFTDERLLSLCDEELQTVIAPMMMAIKGNYFVANYDQTMTTERRYLIPGDAMGLKIKDCYYLDPNDASERPIEITQVQERDVTNQYASGWVNFAFYLQGNYVVLVPRALEGKTLRMGVYKRANKMVLPNAAGTITAIDTNTGEVTLDNLPITWVVGDLVNCIDETPGFITLASDLEITGIAGNVVTLDDVTNLSVGDWIALNGETPVAQIPPEAFWVLAQSVACKCLEALGDPNMPTAQAKFEQIKTNFMVMNAPRVDDQPAVIVQRNGPLAWGSWANWRRW